MEFEIKQKIDFEIEELAKSVIAEADAIFSKFEEEKEREEEERRTKNNENHN